MLLLFVARAMAARAHNVFDKDVFLPNDYFPAVGFTAARPRNRPFSLRLLTACAHITLMTSWLHRLPLSAAALSSPPARV